MKHVPLRKCIAFQEMFPRTQLFRVVRTPGGRVEIDLTGKAPGRGAYLLMTKESIDLAQKKRALEHALRMQIDPCVYDQLRAMLDDVGELNE